MSSNVPEICANNVGVKLQEGAWRLVGYEYGSRGHQYHYIEHNCVGPRDWSDYNPGWCGFTYLTRNRGMDCPRCNQAPPEGMQACFWFLRLGDCDGE